MRLKALEVQGFKTFPEKTKLSFTEGITAVVGPNGSGKSNISDAIRWVLGEQSAKALRCSKMEDVIFNGTKERKKAGYAQVTLSFDNADRTLQFDGDEVAITRRYYRSGNSEYLINNTTVRLQDIHELFMDTGLGRDGYSMIGQGKIDSIVATKGEDRREIFEEAAGISKFRYKKADAERRLDKAEDNLLRLRDILSELESRVGPLKIQSEKAKAFLTYEEEKKGLEIALWLKNLDKSDAAVKEQEDNLAIANAQLAEIEQALEGISSEIENNLNERNKCNADIDILRREISSCEEKSAELRSKAEVLRNDIKHNEETIIRIGKDIKELSSSRNQHENLIVKKRDELSKISEKLEEERKNETECTNKLLTLRGGESDSADKITAVNVVLTGLTDKASDAKVKFMTSSASITQLTERGEVIENTIKANESKITTLKNIISSYQKSIEECDTKFQDASARKEKAQNVLQQDKNKSEELKRNFDSCYLKARQLSDKAKMLEDLERNLEGFVQSVKNIMKEVQRGGLGGIHGPVSRVIKTPLRYSTAIEIALGAAMQNIVTSTDEDAKRAIRYLKSSGGGRATFLPLSTIKGRELVEKGIENCKGFIGIAAELCSCEEQYRDILMNLLGRIVVVEDLDSANAIAKKYGYRFKVVTLDGQVINTGGSLTGGSLSKNTGLLGRTEEIQKLRAESDDMNQKGNGFKKAFDDIQQKIRQDEQEIIIITAEQNTINADKIKFSAEMRSRSSELESTQQQLAQVMSERENSVSKLDELTETMEDARKLLDDYRKQISEQEKTVKELTGSKEEFTKKREALSEELQNIKLRILSLEKDETNVNDLITSSAAARDGADDKIKAENDEAKRLKELNKTLDSDIKRYTADAAKKSDEAKIKRSHADDITQSRLVLENRSNQLRQEEKGKIEEKEHISRDIARLEERRNNLKAAFDETEKKLWEDYNLTRREAERIAIPIEDPSKSQKRLNELKQKIRNLGSVNVGAIEEYKEVNARYIELKDQLGDVEKSKSELLKLINDLTKQMRDIFIESFEMINKNFAQTFTELFGGGRASLSLSDPENVLTTGIEISVEPPGKIVSHIELLSGGEKALVAIALYFAIMKVSPAPFCVMDEIEAALDDVNVYRFAEYLRRMNDRTQFICITHRRGTMEEADVLYGVTMQDRGISKLLELKASEIEQKLGMKA